MKTIKKPFKVFAIILAIPILTILLSPLRSYADDTAALQALLNAGPVTLPSGHTYSVTGLTANYNLNMNGDVITLSTTTGTALRIMKAGVTVSNGTIQGTWVPTSSVVAAAYSGIGIYASNVTVTNMVVQKIQGYGIVCSGALNGLVITNNHILNVSYIGFYFDAESAATTGGTCSGNTVDRSQIPVANIHYPGLAIRGSTSNGTLTTGWTVANNVIKMPADAVGMDATAACMELRYITNTTLSGNTFSGGSMGASIIETSGMKVINNKFSGHLLEAVELGDAKGMVCQNNVVSGGLGVGYLFDGSVGSNGVTITGDVISGTTGACIHSTKGTQNITMTNCTFTASSGTEAMNLQQTSAVNIVNSTFKGGGLEAILLDTCPGNLTVNGGTISNFTKCVVYISNSSASVVTNNVTMTGVTVSGVPAALNTYLANGGTIGKAITVHN